jgi:hypothetical protein
MTNAYFFEPSILVPVQSGHLRFILVRMALAGDALSHVAVFYRVSKLCFKRSPTIVV